MKVIRSVKDKKFIKIEKSGIWGLKLELWDENTTGKNVCLGRIIIDYEEFKKRLGDLE